MFMKSSPSRGNQTHGGPLNIGRQFDHRQPLADQLSGEVDVDTVLEGDDNCDRPNLETDLSFSSRAGAVR